MDLERIKGKALKSLNGNYAILIVAMLIFGLLAGISHLTSILISVPPIEGVLSLIVTGILYMGLTEIILKIARNKKASINDLFDRADLFFRCLAITIILSAICIVCYMLEYISINSLIVFINYHADMSALLSTFMIIVGIVLSIAVLVFSVIIGLSFSQVYFVLYDHQNMSLLDIFKKSMDIMEDHKIDLILLYLSFIGWIILAIFTFGLLFIWLLPYMSVTKAVFYDEIKHDDKALD